MFVLWGFSKFEKKIITNVMQIAQSTLAIYVCFDHRNLAEIKMLAKNG